MAYRASVDQQGSDMSDMWTVGWVQASFAGCSLDSRFVGNYVLNMFEYVFYR